MLAERGVAGFSATFSGWKNEGAASPAKLGVRRGSVKYM
jgi:hypothetical protein